MEISDRSVDEFLASLPEDVRDDLIRLDSEIVRVLAGHRRALYTGRFWGGSDQEIIGYGSVTYPRSGGKQAEWFLVGLALQKQYISVYVSAVEDGRYLAETLGPDLGRVKVGKSSIGFKRLEDIDLTKLSALVARAREVTTP